jgi:hypothetical protein
MAVLGGWTISITYESPFPSLPSSHFHNKSQHTNMKARFIISLLVAATSALPFREVPPAFPSDIFRISDQRLADSVAVVEACFQDWESVECQIVMSSFEAKHANPQPKTRPSPACLRDPTGTDCEWIEPINGGHNVEDNATESDCQNPESPECYAAIASGY